MSAIDLDTLFRARDAGGSTPLARLFGVRHLSPAAGYHLGRVLDALRPTAVLVEGPSDATDQIPHLVHKATRPPLALLAYTQQRPVRSILYPLAEYSPEWVALTWGVRHRAETRFIDLPAAVFLEWHHRDEPPPEADDPTPDEASGPARPSIGPPASEHTLAYLDDPYEAIARLAGEVDHETWWERHFEHTTDPAAYLGQIDEFGRGLRSLRDLGREDENLLRESFMRRCIREVLAAGHDPRRVLVVCGAFHASALTTDLEPMTDAQAAALPRVSTSLTLMPYSYYRLSSQSGYGAGNHAPAYYQALYRGRLSDGGDGLAPRFLAELCDRMRRAGQVRSAAEVIEAVRLARSLAALAGSHAPTLRDLRDAAVTCLGRGEVESIRPHLHDVEIGHEIGALPKGISRTALQDDFYHLLDGLKLAKYQTEKAQDLELDLRENRFVKSEAAAFLDRNRSTFLHRLALLGVEFGEPLSAGQDQATWKERWRLRWDPECEIRLVESALKGDTVELAAAIRLSERLGECERVDQAAEVVKDAARCQLADALEDARRRLQAMAVEDSGFVPLALAADNLAETIRYGSVRQVDPEPLRPLLAQLFLRATLQARGACTCDRAAAKEVQRAILILNRVATESEADVDAPRWDGELDAIAASDALNPYLSGLACALVLEKGRLAEGDLAREVARRLSPGADAELAAGWFEGLVQYNRMGLFSRVALWRQLDAYITGLDEDDFRHALVFLRRAFGGFAPGEVRRVVSNLVEISNEAAEELKASADVKLDEDEVKRLQEQLGDLDLSL
jgi:hypothetical protein